MGISRRQSRGCRPRQIGSMGGQWPRRPGLPHSAEHIKTNAFMKVIISILRRVAALGGVLATLVASAEPEPLKLLTVGNSFAYDATHYLPAMAESAGRRVEIFHANIGGASFERQVKQIELESTTPDAAGARPYTNRVDPRSGERRDLNLREALAAESWDVVTIQQASPLSHRAETYEPHATTLIHYIRTHAPGAEIVVHQTWAYRQDYAGYAKEGTTMEQMHEGLVSAYQRLAAAHGLRIIPGGEAFHTARQTPRWTFSEYPDPDYDYANPAPGALPRQVGGLNAGWRWTRDAKTGKEKLWHDYLHANDEGRYLLAAVWFEVLSGRSAEEISFVPPTVSAADARVLREIAHATVQARRGAVETVSGK